MPTNKDKRDQPPAKFITTPEALDKARQVATALGLHFDAEQTAIDAEKLHITYYDEITSVLGIDASQVDFVSGSYRLVNAMADVDISGSSTIRLDELLDGWLMVLNHMKVIIACKVLSSEERTEILSFSDDIIGLDMDAYTHEEIRDRFLPFAVNHPDALNISHPLSRAMLIFVICHELAHCTLRHVRGDSSPAYEIEADEKAAEYFKIIIRQANTDQHIFIDPKLASAPLLLMRFFELRERKRTLTNGLLPDRTTHPAPSERHDRLQLSLAAVLTGKASFLAEGLNKAVSDMADALGLPALT